MRDPARVGAPRRPRSGTVPGRIGRISAEESRARGALPGATVGPRTDSGVARVRLAPEAPIGVPAAVRAAAARATRQVFRLGSRPGRLPALHAAGGPGAGESQWRVTEDSVRPAPGGAVHRCSAPAARVRTPTHYGGASAVEFPSVSCVFGFPAERRRWGTTLPFSPASAPTQRGSGHLMRPASYSLATSGGKPALPAPKTGPDRAPNTGRRPGAIRARL